MLVLWWTYALRGEREGHGEDGDDDDEEEEEEDAGFVADVCLEGGERRPW